MGPQNIPEGYLPSNIPQGYIDYYQDVARIEEIMPDRDFSDEKCEDMLKHCKLVHHQ